MTHDQFRTPCMDIGKDAIKCRARMNDKFLLSFQFSQEFPPYSSVGEQVLSECCNFENVLGLRYS